MANDDLEVLPGVGPATADQLTHAGYETVEALAVAKPGELTATTSIDEIRAKEIIRAARDHSDASLDELTSGLAFEQSARVTTGIPPLDECLGGGFETGSIAQVYGNEDSGRSRLAHQLAVRAQLPEHRGGLGGHGAYIGTRGTFSPELIRTIVEGLPQSEATALADRYGFSSYETNKISEAVLNHITTLTPAGVTEQLLSVEQLHEDLASDANLTFIAVDSISKQFEIEFPARADIAERQQKFNKHLHHLLQVADIHDTHVFLTNATASSAKPYGGEIITHNVPYTLRLLNTSSENRRIRIEDSPQGAPDREITLIPESGRFVAASRDD